MATTVIETVGSGEAITTIAAWEAALPADLVAADEVRVCQLKNQVFNEAVTIAGQTTDATRYIHLTTEAGASFQDNVNVRTNALRYNASNGQAWTGNIPLTITTAYTRVSKLQIDNNSGYHSCIVITGGGTPTENTLVDSCILNQGGGSGGGSAWGAAHPSNKLVNSLVECHSSGNLGVGGQGQVLNCTVVNTAGGGTGATSGYSNLTVTNTAVFGFATAFSGAAGAGSGFNATDAATAFGSNNQTSLTFASQFENAANDFRATAAGSLDLNATPDTTNATNDISGTARHASTPTIGAWEVTGGVVTKAPPIFHRSQRFMRRR